MRRIGWSLLLSGIMFFGVFPLAAAKDGDAPKPAPSGKTLVQSELTFILAAKEPAKMDSRLEHMAKDLRRAFAGRYRRFDFHKAWKPALKKGETKEFQLPGKGSLKITFRGSDGPYLRLHLNMPDWDGVVRVRDGRRFFHAGRKHGDSTLIIGIKLSSESGS